MQSEGVVGMFPGVTLRSGSTANAAGFPEVIYGENKTAATIAATMQAQARQWPAVFGDPYFSRESSCHHGTILMVSSHSDAARAWRWGS